MSENMLRGSLTSNTSSKGTLGFKGERGYSNYEIYVKNGGTMTEQEWLDHFGVDLTDYIKTSEVVDLVYPVGSLYMSMNSTNPSTLFGGTWEQIQGRYLLGAGAPNQNTNTNMGSLTQEQLTWNFTAGETLGEYTHTLTTAELPNITGTVVGSANIAKNVADAQLFSANGVFSTKANNSVTTVATGATNPTLTYVNELDLNIGGGQVHNTMSACLVVYMWKRTQ